MCPRVSRPPTLSRFLEPPHPVCFVSYIHSYIVLLFLPISSIIPLSPFVGRRPLSRKCTPFDPCRRNPVSRVSYSRHAPPPNPAKCFQTVPCDTLKLNRHLPSSTLIHPHPPSSTLIQPQSTPPSHPIPYFLYNFLVYPPPPPRVPRRRPFPTPFSSRARPSHFVPASSLSFSSRTLPYLLIHPAPPYPFFSTSFSTLINC